MTLYYPQKFTLNGIFGYVGADYILKYVRRNFLPRCQMWWHRFFKRYWLRGSSAYPICCTNFETISLLYLCMTFLFCCFISILIKKYINRVTFYFRFAIVASVPNQDDCVSLIKHKRQNQTLNKMKSCLSNSNFFVWVQLRWEVIIHFVDNGGIDDHHCLNFLFIIPI